MKASQEDNSEVSIMISLFERANKTWDYFKRGNSEFRQFWGIWNFILLIAIKLNINLTWIMIAAWTMFFVPVCIVIGVFFTKKVNTMANKTNPFTQDNLQGSIYFHQSMLSLFELLKTGDENHLEKATEMMKASLQLKEKWMNL